MTLTVISSNSSGNGYVIQNDDEALVLECGVRYSEVQKAVDFNTSKIVAALVTHEHGDHFKYVNEYMSKAVKVYASAGTWEAKNISSKNILKHGEMLKVGNFKIMPFGVKHDVAEPLGFLIDHPETGQILFATDTYYIPYLFGNVSHWLIECNYRKDILDEKMPEGDFVYKKLRDRTLQSHMSYDTCVKALKANDLSVTRNIVLIHLSDRNSHAEDFRRNMAAEIGKAVHIAESGKIINLKKYGF